MIEHHIASMDMKEYLPDDWGEKPDLWKEGFVAAFAAAIVNILAVDRKAPQTPENVQ